VLLQGYPHLEFIVIDGGSLDETKSILNRYSPWIKYWVCEPDNGQSDALNKGFALASGDVCAYLNSDDIFLPNALLQVGLRMSRADHPCWIATTVEDIYPSGLRLPVAPLRYRNINDWVDGRMALPQPGVFWRRDAVTWAPVFDASLHYLMDRDFFMKMCIKGIRLEFAPEILSARFRLHSESKTVSQSESFHGELRKLSLRYLAELSRFDHRELRRKFAVENISVCLQRFSNHSNRNIALFELFQVLKISPSTFVSRMFLGALRRILIEKI